MFQIQYKKIKKKNLNAAIHNLDCKCMYVQMYVIVNMCYQQINKANYKTYKFSKITTFISNCLFEILCCTNWFLRTHP